MRTSSRDLIPYERTLRPAGCTRPDSSRTSDAGFGLPTRAPLPAGAAARPVDNSNGAHGAHAGLRDTFGRWDELEAHWHPGAHVAVAGGRAGVTGAGSGLCPHPAAALQLHRRAHAMPERRGPGLEWVPYVEVEFMLNSCSRAKNKSTCSNGLGPWIWTRA